MFARPAGSWVLWPGAAGPCLAGSRCFMGISFGLVFMEGLPAAGWATWVNVGSGSGTRRRGKRLGRRVAGRRAARRPWTTHENIRRVAVRAGPGRFHRRMRELKRGRQFTRMFMSRTLNGSGALGASPMFVAATVRLLLPPVALRRITDAKSLRRRRIQIAAVPFLEAKIRGGGWHHRVVDVQRKYPGHPAGRNGTVNPPTWSGSAPPLTVTKPVRRTQPSSTRALDPAVAVV